MRPALNVRVRAENLADLASELRHPQKLHVMPWIGFMHAGGNDRTDVQLRHVLRNVLRCPAFLRQRHVEVGLLRSGFEWPRWVHRCERGRSHKRWRLLERRLHLAWYCDDVIRPDKLHQVIEGRMERVEQAVRL